MNYVIWKWYCIFQMNNIFFSKEYCITSLFKSIFHEVLSERNAAFLKNTNVYANYIFQKCYPSQKGLLQRSLWKGWHIFRKYMEDKAHLFFTLSQRNVAPSVEECCIEVCHNFLKECHILFKFSTMTYEKHAVARKIWVDTLLGFRHTTFFKGTVCLPLQNIPYLSWM